MRCLNGALVGIKKFLKMGLRGSLVVFHLLVLLVIVHSNKCDRKITRRKFYSKETRIVRVANHFGNVLVKKHSDDSETRVLVEVNLLGTLLHAADPPIVFTDHDNGEKVSVMVGSLAESSSSVKPSLVSTWLLALPLITGLVFQRKTLTVVMLILFSVWVSVTAAQDDCPSGDIEVFMPRNSCFSVTSNQDGNGSTINIVDCVPEDQPQIISCSVSGYLYSNCTEGSRGVQLSWDVAFSAATNNSLAMSDTPILIEWSLKAIDCPTCPMVTPFTTILELHEVADIRDLQSRSRVLPSDNLPITNGSIVTFILRVDTPREGYSVARECNGSDGSTIFTNAVPFNPGPLSGQLSFNSTVFNAHQSVAVMAASEVCFSLRDFENGVCAILLYRASLGTTICGNDSINFTALQTSTNDNVHACLQASGELDVGRYFVTIEATDHAGLSTVSCSNTSFIVDNIPPQFVSINSTCFTQGDSNFEERLSWDIQALSGIVAIHYSVSNTNNSQSFEPFSTLVNPHQLSYNIQPLLQGHSDRKSVV